MYIQQMKLVTKITGLWIMQLLARGLQWALYGLGEITPDGTSPRFAMLEYEEWMDRCSNVLQQSIDKNMQTLGRLPWNYSKSTDPWTKQLSAVSLIVAIIACMAGAILSIVPLIMGIMFYPMMRWIFQRPNGAYSWDPECQDVEPSGPSIRWLLYWVGWLPEVLVACLTWGGWLGMSGAFIWASEALKELGKRKKTFVDKLTVRLATTDVRSG